jgi:RimJ/RimL family protein N-acetyltransferase
MSIAPILRDVPLAFETERLIIRPARPGEGAILNTAIHESLNQLRPWLPWVHPMPSAEESEIHVRRKYAQYLAREDFTLRLWSKKTGDLIGSSGLHPQDWSVPMFEIGYWCRSQYSGQGYITEATQGIARFGFENVRAERIEIRCEKSNARSRRVAERAGFRLDATLKNRARTVDGTLCDILLFSLTREEFAGLASNWPPIKVL